MEQPTPTIEFHLTAHDDEHVAVYSGTSAQQASTEVVDGVMGLLRELPRGWLLYLHGVEPLAHPRWRELIDAAVTAGHRIALDSRGTLPLSRYAALGEAAGQALRRLLVRLNLIEVGRFSDFIERVVAVRGRLSEQAEVIVTAPLLEETFADLRRFESLCDEAQVPFRYELLVEGGNLARYSPEVERHVRGRVLHDAGDLRERSVRGMLCHAGQLYLTVDTRGDVFRCQALSPNYRLGSLTEGGNLNRFTGPRPCVASRCLAAEAAEANMLQEQRGGLVEILRVGAEGLLGSLRPVGGRALEKLRRPR